MLENVQEIFDLSLLEFRRARKKTYEERMTMFRQNNKALIDEMVNTVSEAEDKEAAAKNLSEVFCNKVYDRFEKRGKIRGTLQQDLSMFMIYYVFTSIQLTGNENATMLCDILLEEWKVKFDNPGMRYGEYQDLLSSFKERIFGLF